MSLRNKILSFALLAQTPAPPPPPPPFTPVGGSLIKIPDLFRGAPGPAGQLSFGALVTLVLQIALLIVGSIAVLFLVYGGYRYITSSGNEEVTEEAKKIIVNAILGLVIVILSFAVITIISRILVTGAII